MKKIRSLYGVDEYRLENGLRVLYRHETAAPVVAVCVTYHVGSRNEAKGHTGSTHILEHLLFKDTEHFKKAEGRSPMAYLEWLGANLNASTWLDRTNYFESVPNDCLEDALAIESDRMRGALFTEEDLASEMTVVRNEYEQSRNNPFELLDEAIMEKAYTTHPYRIPTIGTKEDIENSTATKLREFYDTFYWPDNATLMIAGDVPWNKVEKLVTKYFAPIPRSPHPIPTLKVKEPTQTKARTIALKKPMGVSIASLYYKMCEGTHKDYAALLVGITILAGGYSSRLQKALVDSGLAASVSAYAHALHDPGLASFSAHVAPDIVPQSVIKVMRREIERFVTEGSTPDELTYAKERILTSIAPQRDGVFSEIRAVSEAVAAGDWTLAYALPERIAKLTGKEVDQVARKYLVRTNETSGTLTDTE